MKKLLLFSLALFATNVLFAQDERTTSVRLEARAGVSLATRRRFLAERLDGGTLQTAVSPLAGLSVVLTPDQQFSLSFDAAYVYERAGINGVNPIFQQGPEGTVRYRSDFDSQEHVLQWGFTGRLRFRDANRVGLLFGYSISSILGSELQQNFRAERTAYRDPLTGRSIELEEPIVTSGRTETNDRQHHFNLVGGLTYDFNPAWRLLLQYRLGVHFWGGASDRSYDQARQALQLTAGYLLY